MTNEQLQRTLDPLLPGVDIYCGRPERELPDVIMLAVADLVGDLWQQLPNLKLIQKLGAGVNQIVSDPDLPNHVRIARLAADAQAEEIAEYCLAYVLRYQRNMPGHEADARRFTWHPVAPKRTQQTAIGVLGLGQIGGHAARLFVSLGYQVMGWSRSPKSISGVNCVAGDAALHRLLSVSDYIVSTLPSTPQTCDLFDAELFAFVKPGAVLINVGRGDLIVESVLIKALDENVLAAAVLDVFCQEPLPPEHPFWHHPKITITPHVSGWHLDAALEDVAENYQRLVAGRPLLHEVNKQLGY